METDRYTLQRKWFFLVFCILVAANLMVVSIKLASNKSIILDFPKITIQKDLAKLGSGISHSLNAVASTTSQAIKLATSIPDVSTFIKPVDNVRTPIIVPLPTVSSSNTLSATKLVSTVSPLPVPQVGSVVPKPQLSLPQAKVNDAYAWGNCIWWVSIRRAQTNDPIPNSWGNASSWALSAMRDGYVVDHHPSPGAIMQLPYTDGGLGHVAFVESVDPDGTWHISEMNVMGLDVVDHKDKPASTALNYNFIHDKAM